jgi:hypothetical protein
MLGYHRGLIKIGDQNINRKVFHRQVTALLVLLLYRTCGVENDFGAVHFRATNGGCNCFLWQSTMNQTNISFRDNLFSGIDVLRLQGAVGAAVVAGGVFAFSVNQRYSHAGILSLSRIDKVGIDIEF